MSEFVSYFGFKLYIWGKGREVSLAPILCIVRAVSACNGNHKGSEPGLELLRSRGKQLVAEASGWEGWPVPALSRSFSAAPWAMVDHSAVNRCSKSNLTGGAGRMQGIHSTAWASRHGGSSQFVQPFESLLSVLLGAASGCCWEWLNPALGRWRSWGTTVSTIPHLLAHAASRLKPACCSGEGVQGCLSTPQGMVPVTWC